MPVRGSTIDVIVGSGDHTYRVHENRARLPKGFPFGDVAAVGIDNRDRVYAFNRSAGHPMMVFDRDGTFLSSWARDLFAHALASAWGRTIRSTAPTI